MSHRIVFSCVVDVKPKFIWQCFIFVNTLISNAGVAAENIYIHLMDEVPVLEAYLKDINVNVIHAKRWGDGKYCNKLAQFDTEALMDNDYIFLCDCDIAFANDICDLVDKYPNFIMGKTVDSANPSLEILNYLFDKYSCRKPETVDTYYGTSFVNNCNGGLLGFPKKYFKEFGIMWREYATKLLADNDAIVILKEKKIHIDQIAFSFLLSSSKFPFQVLDSVYNTPTHYPSLIPVLEKRLAGVAPRVLHYHEYFDNIGLLKNIGNSLIDSSTQKINDVIKEKFNNKLFWDHRYMINPELGSGVGSRGELMLKKQKILKLYGAENVDSVLDVGCGDGEVISPLDIDNYTGIDMSLEALKLSAAKRPNGKFIPYHERENAEAADIVICLDVLLHQDSIIDYNKLILYISEKASKRLIVSGYGKSEDVDSSCMCHYYEDLHSSLEKTGLFEKIYKVSRYRGLDVIVADKVVNVLDTAKNSNDISDSLIEHIISEHETPELFLSLVEASRSLFGWYTKHYPRVWEYPWIISEIGEELCGLTVAEFGAGLSPLPLVLSEHGAKVITLDRGPEVNLKDVAGKCEWGFFDYSQLDNSLKSYNSMLNRGLFAPESIDVWFSVSVIEHASADVRRETFSIMRESLKHGGKLLLTVDLCKNSTNLWNRSQNKEVEPVVLHGTLQSIIDEIEYLGFGDINTQIIKMPESERVDIAYISATVVSRSKQKKSKAGSNIFSRIFRTIKDIRAIKKSKLFDSEWYLSQYPDVLSAGVDPVKHYLTHGWIENRNPSAAFETTRYIESHPEINMCPLVHYIQNRKTSLSSSIIPSQVIDLFAPVDFSSVYELGNKKTNDIPYRSFYTSRGIEYTSIDLNGLDGALSFDLSKPIDLPPKDIVMNIGTSEHVYEQEQVFRNIHNLSSNRMVHWVPLASKHTDHGCWGYSIEFFKELAELNNYSIEKLYIEESFKNWTIICCSYKKNEKTRQFTWSNDLPLIYNENGSMGVDYR